MEGPGSPGSNRPITLNDHTTRLAKALSDLDGSLSAICQELYGHEPEKTAPGDGSKAPLPNYLDFRLGNNAARAEVLAEKAAHILSRITPAVLLPPQEQADCSRLNTNR